jgi:hypothetical protein
MQLQRMVHNTMRHDRHWQCNQQVVLWYTGNPSVSVAVFATSKQLNCCTHSADRKKLLSDTEVSSFT